MMDQKHVHHGKTEQFVTSAAAVISLFLGHFGIVVAAVAAAAAVATVTVT